MAESHDDSLKRILDSARLREECRNDLKNFCSVDDLLTLLDAGARAISLNVNQTGGGYVHNVQYEKFFFVSATDEEVSHFNRYLARRQ